MSETEQLHPGDEIHFQEDDSLLLPAPKCPTCETVLTHASGVALNRRAQREPNPGTISVCAFCGEVSVYTKQMQLRLLTEMEIERLQKGSQWPLLLEMVRVARSPENEYQKERVKPLLGKTLSQFLQ